MATKTLGHSPHSGCKAKPNQKTIVDFKDKAAIAVKGIMLVVVQGSFNEK